MANPNCNGCVAFPVYEESLAGLQHTVEPLQEEKDAAERTIVELDAIVKQAGSKPISHVLDSADFSQAEYVRVAEEQRVTRLSRTIGLVLDAATVADEESDRCTAAARRAVVNDPASIPEQCPRMIVLLEIYESLNVTKFGDANG